MEARQGRDAAGGSMRNAHDSATGHVSWPGTHSLQGSMHKLMRQSSGNRFDSDYCGLADPAQPVRRSLRGAKHRAAGIARRAFPWRQAKRAAPQARRREGLKPNGRDSEVGTGRSPKARRRSAPTRPGSSRFPNRKRGHASDEMGAAYAAGYALGKLKTAGDSCALRALRLAVPCGPAIAGREARSRQRRRLNCRDGGGVLIRLLALNTGRGHCRARILRPPRPGRNGLGAVLIAVIPSSR